MPHPAIRRGGLVMAAQGRGLANGGGNECGGVRIPHPPIPNLPATLLVIVSVTNPITHPIAIPVINPVTNPDTIAAP